MTSPIGKNPPYSCHWVKQNSDEIIIKEITDSPKILKKIAKDLLIHTDEIHTFQRVMSCIKQSEIVEIDQKIAHLFLNFAKQQKLIPKVESLVNLKKIIPAQFENSLSYLSLKYDEITEILLYATAETIHELSKNDLFNDPFLVDKSLIFLCSNPSSNPDLIKHFISRQGNVNYSNGLIQGINQTPLLFACKNNPALIPTLLENKAEANFYHYILACGHPKTLPKTLASLIKELEKECPNKNFINFFDRNGMTGLHYACQSNPALIAVLLQKKASPFIKNKEGLLPIHLLCLQNFCTEDHLVKLIEAGADINQKDSRGFTPLIHACNTQPLNLPLINILIKLGADVEVRDSEANTVLHHLCNNSSAKPEGVEAILEKVQNKKNFINYLNKFKENALHRACQSKIHPSILELLLSEGCDFHAFDSSKRLPITYACSNPSFSAQTIQSLFQYLDTSYINYQDSQGQTLLHHVCSANNVRLSAIAILLLKNASVFIVDQTNQSPLYVACANPRASLASIEILAEAAAEQGDLKVYLNQKKIGSNTPAIFEACLANHDANVIDYLISQGANATFIHSKYGSLLHILCLHQNVSEDSIRRIIQALKEEGKDLQAFLNLRAEGKTALEIACESKVGQQIIEMLIDCGTRIDSHNMPFFQRICENPSITSLVLQKFIEVARNGMAIQDYINQAASDGETAIERACKVNPLNSDTIITLVKLGAKPRNGSVLHHLCKNISLTPDLLQKVIEHELDVNLTNDEGLTATQIACACKPPQSAVIQTLIHYRADIIWNNTSILHALCSNPSLTPELLKVFLEEIHPSSDLTHALNLKNSLGETPLAAYVKISHNPEIVQLLFDYGATVEHADLLPLHLACQNSQMLPETLQLIVEAGRHELEAGEYVSLLGEDGTNAIEKACLVYPLNGELIKLLIKLGARTNDGCVLHHLCQNTSLTPELLVDLIKDCSLEEDIHLLNNDRLTVIQVACTCRPINPAIIKILYQLNASLYFQEGETITSILHTICTNPDVTPKTLQAVIDMMASDEDVKDFIDLQNEFGETALAMHVQNGGNPIIIELLTDYNANILLPNMENNTPLHLACMHETVNPEILRHLISAALLQNSNDYVNQQNEIGQTALHILLNAHNLHEEAIQLLLESHSDVRLGDMNQQTPLHIACINPFITITCLNHLFETAFRQNEIAPFVNMRDRHKRTALHYFCLCGKLEHAIFNLLISEGSRVDDLDADSNSTLHLACQNPFVTPTIIHSILTQNSRPHRFINLPNQRGETALHQVCLANDLKIDLIETLIKKNADVGALDKNKKTTLHFICEHSQASVEILLLLIDNVEHRKNYIDQKDTDGCVAIQIACSTTLLNERLIAALIDLGADLTVEDKKGDSLLHLVSNHSTVSLRILEKIVAKSPLQISQINQKGLAPLHYCIANGCHPKTLKFFVENGADIMRQDKSHRSCLEYLIMHADTTSKRLYKFLSKEDLKKFGQLKFHGNNTLLHIACLYNTPLVKSFLELEYDVEALNLDQMSPLHFLCLNSRASPKNFEQLTAKLTHLMIYEYVNQETSNGDSPLKIAAAHNPHLVKILILNGAKAISLHEACKNKEMKLDTFNLLIQQLIEYKRSLDERNDKNQTVLHIACAVHPQFIATLVKHKARRGLLDHNGQTPLHLACRNQEITVSAIKSLIENEGIQLINQEDENGVTPFLLACQFARFEIIQKLLPHANLHLKDAKKRSPLLYLCKNTHLDLKMLHTIIQAGIPLESFNHSEFTLTTFLALIIEFRDHKLLVGAIQNGLSIGEVHEILNTSECFFHNVYFLLIKKHLISLLKTDVVNLEEIESELEFKKVLKTHVSRIFKNAQFSGNPLEIPLLLQDRQLLRFFEREIRALWGKERLQSLHQELSNQQYALADLKNMEYFVNPCHFTKTLSEHKKIPTAPDFDLQLLEKLFLEINFTDPSLPGYRDPTKLTSDGSPTTPTILHLGLQQDGNGGIRGLIKRMQERPKNFAGVPQEDSAHQKHYDDFENILKHLGHLLPQLDVDSKTSVLLDISVMGLFCGGKIAEAKRMYELYCTSSFKGLYTLENLICNQLQDHRHGIIENWIKSIPGMIYETHRYNHLMFLVGKTLNLPFADTFSVPDPYAGIEMDAKEILQKFRYEYTPMEIFENVKNHLLECLQNPQLRNYVLDWFKDNVPSNFHKQKYDRLKRKIKLLEASGNSRDEIRKKLAEEDVIQLPPDQTIEEAIAMHRRKHYLNNYKHIPLEEWKKDVYEPILDWVKNMRHKGDSPEKIYHELEKHAIVLKQVYEDEEDMPLDITPEKLVLEHRRQDHFFSEILENDWEKDMYDTILKEVAAMNRSEATHYLQDKGITLENQGSLISLLEQERAIEYQQSVIQFNKKFIIKSNSAIFRMLRKMKILNKSLKD
ncbi:ankyrin repeat domain-containing protein [Parachlamydia acanthamoebae]|uniref:ankyrin repeat domain-containing protein n=1 Tax=Parachlamydia acanthamoebae TaxID=83552 RepID=UPI0024E235BF|nr:ankyrin repeat domain-containing protein [Parachlamydia acanthamoebae]